MGYKFWISISLIIVSLIFMILNKKILSKDLFSDLFHVFRNNKNDKKKDNIYWFDLISFFVCPLLISFGIVWGFDFYFDKEIIEILLTVYSIIFTLLFGVMNILVTSINSEESRKSRISKEAFTVVSFSLFVSLFIVVLLVLYRILIDGANNTILNQILSGIIIFLSGNLVMLFLLIIKRTYLTSIFDN